jgi:hypothetical protein
MSNTRHASDSSLYCQNRYMSDPAFAEQRGLLGNLVAERASILVSRRKRELLFFLQAESFKPGGLKRVAEEILEMFPDRLGSPTMHRVGIKRGKRYSAEETRCIERELRRNNIYDVYSLTTATGDNIERATVEECLDRCRELSDGLNTFLTDLCLNPNLTFKEPCCDKHTATLERLALERAFAGHDVGLRNEAQVCCFRDIIGALFEYQFHKSEAVKKNFVETDITRRLFESMEFSLECRGLVIVNGNARIGKSTAAAAWCDMNPGLARYVSLVDTSDEAGFYRPIARALGLACSYTRKACELRDRIADMLQKSGLLLVLDEGHYVWPQFLRPTALPRRMNWILTALINNGVPMVLITTPQFVTTQKRVEKNTGWTSEQFKGRIKRFVNLPTELPEKDLEAVARFHLPDASDATIVNLVSYAMTMQTYIAGMVNAIDEARYDAKKSGRTKLTYDDIEKVISGPAGKTNEALALAYDADDRRRQSRRVERLTRAPMIGRAPTSRLQDVCRPRAMSTDLPPCRNSVPAPANGKTDLAQLEGANRD